MKFEKLRELQELFESNLVGNDGDLTSINTPEYSIERGIIGESIEAFEALVAQGMMSEEFREEVVDIYIFFASFLNHIKMSQEELEKRSERKVFINFLKYHPRNFEGRTVKEGLLFSREIWEKEKHVKGEP